MQPKKRALGRGLEALLPPKPTPAVAPASTKSDKDEELQAKSRLPISAIRRNEAQPREYFDEDALQTLADSIKLHGIIQPLAVVPRENDYMIVAGERRFRAAQLAGMREVPVIILDPLTNQEILEFALVENLQRENLNALEEAKAYQSLQNTFNLTAEEIARHVGRSRSAIANALRLLSMPEDMQEDLQTERISPGHARAIMGLEEKRDQESLRNLIVSENMSVRQAEIMAREMLEAGAARKNKSKPSSARTKPEDEHIRQLRDQLVDCLACRVTIATKDGQRGKVEIHFDSLDDLQGLLNQLGVSL